MSSRRARRWSLPLVATVMAVLGTALVATGVHGRPPAAAPLPESTFELSVPQRAAQVGRLRAGATPKEDGRHYSRASTLWIPSQDVSAPLVGEDAPGGDLTIPGDPKKVAVFTGNPGVGAHEGTTVLAGHVSYNGATGAMTRISKLHAGDEVVTTDGSARVSHWAVVAIAVYDKADLPSFPPDGARRLVLVTCGGPVSRSPTGGWHYRDNVIVTAEPVTIGA